MECEIFFYKIIKLTRCININEYVGNIKEKFNDDSYNKSATNTYRLFDIFFILMMYQMMSELLVDSKFVKKDIEIRKVTIINTNQKYSVDIGKSKNKTPRSRFDPVIESSDDYLYFIKNKKYYCENTNKLINDLMRINFFNLDFISHKSDYIFENKNSDYIVKNLEKQISSTEIVSFNIKYDISDIIFNINFESSNTKDDNQVDLFKKYYYVKCSKLLRLSWSILIIK